MKTNRESLSKRIGYMVLMYFLGALPLFFLMVIPYQKNSVIVFLLVLAYFLASALIIYIAYRFVHKYSHNNVLETIELSDLFYVVGGYVFILISNGVLAALNHTIYHQSDTPNNLVLEKSLLQSNILIITLFIIQLVVIAPIIEELIYRGMLFNLFFSSNKTLIKICLSSILFASGHGGNTIFGFLIYVFMGFSFAIVYAKTGKLQNSIAVHIITNAVATVSIFILN